MKTYTFNVYSLNELHETAKEYAKKFQANIVPDKSQFLADGTLVDGEICKQAEKEKIIREQINQIVNSVEKDPEMETMVINWRGELICKRCVAANKDLFISNFVMGVEGCWTIKHIIKMKIGSSSLCFNG